ncbi:MAG: rhomboid family intramembrane serine protease [Candidatus Cyclobacteriaceae bacterium M3_2C_046]
MNGFLDDFKNAFNKPNNALAQIIIINIAIFVILGVMNVITTFGGREVFDIVYNQFTIPPYFQDFILRPWTIITYAFAHSLSDIFHIIFNMLVLYWFGKLIQEYLGSKKLIGLYVWGAIAGGLVYLMAYNLIPFYRDFLGTFSGMVGASASVFAVSVAAATLMPDYRFFLLFIGPVKIKYIVAVYIFISFLGIVGGNAGGNLAHLGGAILGFIFVKQLQKGNDWSQPVSSVMDFFKNLFKRKPKIKVSHSRPRKEKAKQKSYQQTTTTRRPNQPDQKEIDAILDKISEKGYDSLTKEEKEKLFNASK